MSNIWASRHHASTSGRLVRRLRARKDEDQGASLVEYALLLALVAVVAIGALTFLGNTVSGTLNNVGNTIALGASGGGGGGGTTTTTLAPQAPSYDNLVNIAGTPTLVLSSSTYNNQNTTVSVAATGGALPIGYTGTLGNANLTWAQTPSTTGVINVSHNLGTGTYTFTVTANNGVSPNAVVQVQLNNFSGSSLGAQTFNLSTNFNGNRCTVTGTYAAKNLSMSCNDWGWIANGGWYIFYNGVWNDVSNSNAQSLVNPMLNAASGNWTYTTSGGYVNQVVATAGTVAT